MADLLTPHSLRALYDSDVAPVPGFEKPVLQVLAVKQINNNNTNAATNPTERWRVVLSDGSYFIQAMLATQLNTLVHDGDIAKGKLVRVNSYSLSKMKEKKLFIVLSCTVIAEAGELEKLGNPLPLAEEGGANGTTPNPAPAANTHQQGQRPQQQLQQTRQPHGNINVYPIEGLSPYQNKWTIQVRVTYKSDIKEWHNQRGQGRLFTVHFLDESGEIRATGFNDQVDAFYDKLKEGKVYYVSKCRVNIAKKQFSNVQNEYELMFERDTQIEECNENAALPQARFNFVPIGKLGEVEKDGTVDVIGVLKDIGEPSEITSKTTQKAVTKRELIIVDRSSYSVQMTIWGRQAQEFSSPPESIIAVKGAKVSDFNGRSLSLFSSSMMQIDPDLDEAHSLSGWYKNVGRNENFSTHASLRGEGGMAGDGKRVDARKTLSQVKDEGLGMGEAPDYFSCLATVVFVRQENVSYPACRSEGCKKKVVEDGSGQWRCERCDKSWDTPLHRYIMTISVNDHTSQAWFNLFDDVGQKFLGIDANTLVEYKETDISKANEVFQNATFTMWSWRVRGKQDNYQGQVRVRYQVLDAYPVDFKEESARLVKLIQSY